MAKAKNQKRQELPAWVKSWKIWGIVVATTAATLSLTILIVQLAQPVVEYYATRSISAKMDDLALGFYSFKKETTRKLDALKIQISTRDSGDAKELVRLTVLQMQKKSVMASNDQ